MIKIRETLPIDIKLVLLEPSSLVLPWRSTERDREYIAKEN